MLNNENKKWGLSRINEFTNSARAIGVRSKDVVVR